MCRALPPLAKESGLDYDLYIGLQEHGGIPNVVLSVFQAACFVSIHASATVQGLVPSILATVHLLLSRNILRDRYMPGLKNYSMAEYPIESISCRLPQRVVI